MKVDEIKPIWVSEDGIKVYDLGDKYYIRYSNGLISLHKDRYVKEITDEQYEILSKIPDGIIKSEVQIVRLV